MVYSYLFVVLWTVYLGVGIVTDKAEAGLLHEVSDEFEIGVCAKETQELLRIMRELHRRLALWPSNEGYNASRLASLQKRLEKVNSTVEKLNKKLDEESQNFADIQAGLQSLETKINIIAETKCDFKFIQEPSDAKFTTARSIERIPHKTATRQ